MGRSVSLHISYLCVRTCVCVRVCHVCALFARKTNQCRVSIFLCFNFWLYCCTVSSLILRGRTESRTICSEAWSPTTRIRRWRLCQFPWTVELATYIKRQIHPYDRNGSQGVCSALMESIGGERLHLQGNVQWLVLGPWRMFLQWFRIGRWESTDRSRSRMGRKRRIVLFQTQRVPR